MHANRSPVGGILCRHFGPVDPDRLYAVVPAKPADINEGFVDITVAEIARCTNFMAGWIQTTLGTSQNYGTISYIGIADLRGAVVFLAALLLPSPRNPASTNLSLMDQTAGLNVLYAAEVRPIVSQIEQLEPNVRSWEIPSFEDMLKSSPEHFQYEKQFDEARDDPVVVLHSSGSTGLPKPITMTHGSFAVLDNEHNLPQVPGRRKRDWSMWTFDGEARVYTVFPFFHAKVQTIFMNASPVLGPPHMVPDGQLLKHMMLHQKLRSIFLPPAVIEQLLHEPDGIDFFRGLDFLVYSGAPFNPVIGDRLSKVVEIISPFGSTEIYPQPELAPAREDWSWHEFNPLVKYEMQEYDSTEGTFELVVFANESTKDTAAVYHNLPGTKEYRTKDLFIRHPQKPQLYKYYGRRDDIIVLANGEKFNPIPLEVNIQNHPALKGALVIGNGRTQPALLVEPKESLEEEGRGQLLRDIWPLVEKSNNLVPGQGRIHYGKILCALPGLPFTRTGKGTIVRKLTEQAYEDQIDELYAETPHQSEPLAVTLERGPGGDYELPMVINSVRRIMTLSFPQGATIGEHEDFFAYGLDSVQTIEIVANLKRTLRGHHGNPSAVTWISPRTIFHKPNIAELSQTVKDFLDKGEALEEDSDLAISEAVNQTVEKYVAALPTKPTPWSDSATSSTEPPATYTVVLLGSTGFLGSYLLANLLKRENVSRVICLNRAHDAQKRQENSLGRLGVLSLSNKVEYMVIDLGQNRLGFNQSDYEKIVNEADIIIYNAWRLDFGLALRSFSPFLDATKDLVEIAAASNRKARLIFVSSLSSVAAMAGKTVVPEAPIDDPLAAHSTGYGRSKQVAERMLVAASQNAGVPISIIRVSQVGGPTSRGNVDGKNSWADQPWISALVRTSKVLRMIPAKVAMIDWVPVDVVATMLSEIALIPPTSTEAQVYNISNPIPQDWDMMVSVLQEMLGITTTVSFGEWVQKLRDIIDPSADKIAEMPALKMLDYYASLDQIGANAAYATGKATKVSRVEIPQIDKQMLKDWLEGWKL
ncbi:hypothetical protein F5Y04DRAFT_286810 [Hypomontagnella monticulosa]|nr:hypothetical protein F5Y04DRAFT_286810 [Hypomontagnella monticulosa]